jgi:hypothetical protein
LQPFVLPKLAAGPVAMGGAVVCAHVVWPRALLVAGRCQGATPVCSFRSHSSPCSPQCSLIKFTGGSKREDFVPVRGWGKTAHGPTQITFRELAVTTKNFRRVCLLGEGGFGLVYKGHMENG